MVEKVKVKIEYKPERCEICHQADYFNPETNSCSRCAGVTALATNQEKNLSSKKQIPYYNFYIEDDQARKQALRIGVTSLLASVLYCFTLSIGTNNSTNSISILAALVLAISGIGSLIDWFYLRNGKKLILQDYRKLLSQALMFIVIALCIGGQVFLGKVDVYLSLMAGIFLISSFGAYYQLHKKANEANKANIETK